MTMRDPVNPVRRLQLAVYETLADRIAGGRRQDPRALLPGNDDPSEGVMPNYLPEIEGYESIETFDWFDPTAWAGLDASSIPGMDLASIPVGGAGISGRGLDFFRVGEAPNNYANRNNPLYQARKDFAVAVAPRIEDMFGVSSEGSAGYYRAPQASHADPGGPSANSDHYSAGAIDFFGSVERLDALREYLVAQPWVGFVRWRSESHGGPSGTEKGAHLHVSFNLGWIAQNYFQGRQAPALSAPTAPRQPSQAPRQATEREVAATGAPPPMAPAPAPPPIVRGQPS